MMNTSDLNVMIEFQLKYSKYLLALKFSCEQDLEQATCGSDFRKNIVRFSDRRD
jgi:hypothetical protein